MTTGTSTWPSIGRASAYGMMAWAAYAISECLFGGILPWLTGPSSGYLPLNWEFTALTFVLYPATGLIVSGLAALGLLVLGVIVVPVDRARAASAYSSIATGALAAVLAGHLLFQRQGFEFTVLAPLLVLALGFAIALPVCTLRGFGGRHTAALTNPWTASAMLLGLPWVVKDEMFRESMPVKALAASAYVALVVIVSAYAHRRALRLPQSDRTLRRPALLLMGLAAVTFAASLPLHQTPRVASFDPPILQQSQEHPSVVLVSLDTVRADHLSVYGYERDTSPNLRRFSEDAVVYTRAMAPADMTLSTHASMFTGLYPSRHGAHPTPLLPLGTPLSESHDTLAEILSAGGYLTLGVVANHVSLGHAHQLDQGFYYFDERAPTPFFGHSRPYFLRETVRDLLAPWAPPYLAEIAYRSAEDINSEAYTWLESLAADRRRFFLFVNYMEAHFPHVPPPPFDTMFPGKDDSFTVRRHEALYDRVLSLQGAMTAPERAHVVSQYDGGIAHLDAQLGRLFDKLKAWGAYDSSLIIVIGDHGEAFGEHDLMSHGVSVYQDQLHIPLMVKYPNGAHRGVVDSPISTVDILPTVLEVVGQTVASPVEGRSLLAPSAGEPRLLFSETFPNSHLFGLHQRFHRVERAIVSWPFKLISSDAGKRELYDLVQDPDELANLYRPGGEPSLELESTLNAWIAIAQAASSPSPLQLDPNVVRRLRSLGYVR